ncbi:DUF86 domain-containing protein [Candidatus Peregrinibacteria bacterium]|nr:DUF86 domain-containing protein [Candidatus Peregrinibacteria bacterium]
MSFEPLEYVRHILDEMNFLIKESTSLQKEIFLKDSVLQRAFIRSLEIIGEAAKKLPLDFREKYPHIPWRNLCGVRDKLIHDYFGVDYEIVWDIVKNKLPELKRDFELMFLENK